MTMYRKLGYALVTLVTMMYAVVGGTTAHAADSITVSSVAWPQVIPHRGGAALNQESTLTAYRYAVDTLGSPIVDMDLYLTKDHALAVHHDATMHDTTCGNVAVSALTVAQYRACQYPNGDYAVTISQVHQVFGNSVVYTPEIKNLTDQTSAYLVTAINYYSMAGNTMVQASTLAALKPFVQLGATAVLGSVSSDAVANDGQHWVSQMRAAGVHYVSISQDASDDTFNHYAGCSAIYVLAWTIDTRESYDRLRGLAYPPVGYFSNNPPLLTAEA